MPKSLSLCLPVCQPLRELGSSREEDGQLFFKLAVLLHRSGQDGLQRR
jgi:hypothetical protein